ncbi:predicted protein [Lichtheimia corymbifera JMRC:FSU:9682]|uniref:Uncharacterized protein n=1 Tax=Lichtheimia corymbifera JMRC:FSU:9682 TaxID=1263082 RepID=A0A068RW20_9FUNG|nr:predicted protein [Lichtheimia corymbifera JMRC:FSU:9682]
MPKTTENRLKVVDTKDMGSVAYWCFLHVADVIHRYQACVAGYPSKELMINLERCKNDLGNTNNASTGSDCLLMT